MPVSNTMKVDDNDTKDSIILKAAHITPTKNQYEALKNEFITFIHFGPNTFTKKEWGDGYENPKVFNLKNLDTDQWCEAMVAAKMKMVILTVKHHDGFVLWQSRYTKHGIMSTSFKDGKGDILKELAESCKKYGLKLGVYLSPADLFQIESKEGLYGNLSEYSKRTIPRPVEGRPFKNKTTFTFKVDDYNEYFLNQLFELLTEYGPIHEVWFDGAHPKRKGGQKYNYLAWKELITTLAPEAVIFGKQDVRWCGNEAGRTRDTEFNVIPFSDNPHEMNTFSDLMDEDIASREKLYRANFLHYQQTETNTSIREGWFYRDDENQKVRSADDVFDIYERAVGGNTTFLLNIPPNRNGMFSNEDVEVLIEVGKRIKETYSENLFKEALGKSNVLDNDLGSFVALDSIHNSIVITTRKPVTINRIVLQEAIVTHGERVERHALDAWIDNQWEEVVTATNIGYKRILRFPEVKSNKFRIRILESRFYPAISNITAHYYKTKPPQLSITRALNGMVTIQPKQHDFGWNPHGENVSDNINSGVKIRYTTDGTEPTSNSQTYKKPFLLVSGEVKAKAEVNSEKGSLETQIFGIKKKDWNVIDADSFLKENKLEYAIDENAKTYWQSNSNGDLHYISINLGEEYNIKGFTYTPQTEHNEGMIEKGVLKMSKDGKTWEMIEPFEFGNLINDPTPRVYYFKEIINTQYIRVESNVIAGGGNSAAIGEIDFLIE
ncbi:alpha-1,3/4-fucosidase [Aureibaculum marinum]|uniref:alpha-L-fucosidase n=1 Tax=Aureibaculum marinum TaxID=2487930 RepID=A0A3N4NW64_9FLAO|nr:alpha-L-fucosidase [Aureibaculum marinum]RPD98498.1 alpha-1,3/4-fucosidase [Aureibaculum marinum]